MRHTAGVGSWQFRLNPTNSPAENALLTEIPLHVIPGARWEGVLR
jgi:hypothetical protein